MANTARRSAFLFFSVFVVATCGLIYELIAGAMASYLLGDSIRQFSFIIGIYLFAMGVGSYLSKFILNDLLDKFIAIEQLIGLMGGLGSLLLFLLFHYDFYFSFLLYSLVFSIGVCVGVEIPLLMNILRDKFEFKDLVANIFTFDYIGALFASIAFPIILVPNLGLVKTSLCFGMINIGVSLLFIFLYRDELKNQNRLLSSGIVSIITLLLLFYFSNDLLRYSEEKLLGENIIFQKQTPYQKIVLTRHRDDIKLFLNNNLQFSKLDEYRYHEALVHPAMSLSSRIKNVLVLGGGDGMAVRELLKYDSVEQITLVELDRDMSQIFSQNKLLARLNKFSLSNRKVKVINQDAFTWAKNNKQKFDVIIIDFPDPSNYSVGKLYTNYFYSAIKKLCHADTKLVIQSTSPYFAPRSYWMIEHTIKSIFGYTIPYHVYLPSFGEWGFVLASLDSNISAIAQPMHQIDSLRFYDYRLAQLTYFPSDMLAKEKGINSIYNQQLVRIFDEEWQHIP